MIERVAIISKDAASIKKVFFIWVKLLIKQGSTALCGENKVFLVLKSICYFRSNELF
jgi:hypothetical protein